MSHHKEGQLGLKCSLRLLHRALIKVKPEWERYIKMDPGGGLIIYNTYSGKNVKGGSLVVPVKDTPDIAYADVGFIKNPDGSWKTLIDPLGFQGAKELSGEIVKEVSKMRVKAIAKQRGFQIVKEIDSGGTFRIGMLVPVQQKFKLTN